MNERPLVVCFSGRIGSGKTSVTRGLAGRLGWRRAAFGDYLRDRIARENGDPDDRQALQDLGQRLVDQDPRLLCSEVLGHAGHCPGQSLLVDGIRHTAIYRIMTSLVAPVPCQLIHLSADDEEIRERVELRPGGTSDLARAETHRVEAELAVNVPALASIIINGNKPLEAVLNQAMEAIAAMRL